MAHDRGGSGSPASSARDCVTSLWFIIVRRLPATTASLGVLTAPVIGIAASAFALGERPTIPDYIGCALILSAAACVLIAPADRVAFARVKPNA